MTSLSKAKEVSFEINQFSQILYSCNYISFCFFYALEINFYFLLFNMQSLEVINPILCNSGLNWSTSLEDTMKFWQEVLDFESKDDKDKINAL